MIPLNQPVLGRVFASERNRYRVDCWPSIDARTRAGAGGWIFIIIFTTLNLTVCPQPVRAQETVLYRFTTSTGADARGPLIFDSKGNLYGTTEFGGALDRGTVFQLSPPTVSGNPWTETVLYSFQGAPLADGSGPFSGLVFDSAGALYGTTYTGGAHNFGTVFKLSPPATAGGAWTERVLYSFTGGTDGGLPFAGVIFGENGALYGTAKQGGSAGFGVVYKLTPPGTSGGSWQETVLHSFTGGSDGLIPYAGVIFDGSGALFGTTEAGGTTGNGTVYELTSGSGGTWTHTVLYSFQGGSDGSDPQGGLVFDASGHLYGTTLYGGGGGGTAYKLSPPSVSGAAWSESILHSFSSGGTNPLGSLILDAQGNLYGTAFGGGLGFGSVFKLAPDGSFEALHEFAGGTDGTNPSSNLIFDKSGNLYGTTTFGGGVGRGTVFEVATGSTSTFALSVSLAGAGTVNSNPAGINCPGTCTANFASGVNVTLTAAAASGSAFSGWSGACSGTGTCSVTMNAVMSVTATFNSACGAASTHNIQLASSCPLKLTVQQISLSTATPTNIPIYRDEYGSSPLIANSIYPPANPINPAAYPGGNSMKVDVAFSISPIQPVTLNNVTIVGIINDGKGTPAKLIKANVQIPASQTYFTVYSITANAPFPAKTQHYKYMTISWTYQIGGGTPIPIGQTQHEVFITLSHPLQSNVYLTELELAVANGGATSSTSAFQNIWQEFQGLALTTWDRRRLFYYPNGVLFAKSCPRDEYQLLTTGVGQCGAFAVLLKQTLATNGIASQLVTATTPEYPDWWFLVDNWTFGTATLPPPFAYKFVPSSLSPLDLTCPAMSSHGDLASLSGLRGQNVSTPCEKAFNLHYVVGVAIALPGSGCTTAPCYYDPSYGKSYANANAFEMGAVAGYVKYDPTISAWRAVQAHQSALWLRNIFFGYSLDITFSGSGQGTVTANPPGWSCHASCGNYAPVGAAVTLTASPKAGSTFAGWAGCSPVSGNPCTILMNKKQSVTATFQ